jgi:DNA-binding NtrC family response regulator
MNAIPALPPLPMFQTGAKQSKTILVVDDFAPICDLVARHLSAIGYQVLTANDAADAHRMVDSHWGWKVDLLLTDAGLEKAGSEGVVSWFSAKNPGAPVVLMTSQDQQPAVAREAALLQKPFSLAALSAAVRKSLGLNLGEMESNYRN